MASQVSDTPLMLPDYSQLLAKFDELHKTERKSGCALPPFFELSGSGSSRNISSLTPSLQPQRVSIDSVADARKACRIERLPDPFVESACTKADTKRAKKGTQMFVCPECTREFDRQCDATKHYKRKHNTGKHKCVVQECPRTFHWPKDVRRHCIQVHGYNVFSLEPSKTLKKENKSNESASRNPGPAFSSLIRFIVRFKREAARVRSSRRNEDTTLAAPLLISDKSKEQQETGEKQHRHGWVFVTRDRMNFQKVRISSFWDAEQFIRAMLNVAGLTMKTLLDPYRVEATEAESGGNILEVRLHVLSFDSLPSSPMTGSEIKESALQHINDQRSLQILLQVQQRGHTTHLTEADPGSSTVLSKQNRLSLSSLSQVDHTLGELIERIHTVLEVLNTPPPSWEAVLSDVRFVGSEEAPEIVESASQQQRQSASPEPQVHELTNPPSSNVGGHVFESDTTHQVPDSFQMNDNSGSQEQHNRSDTASHSTTSECTSNRSGGGNDSSKRPPEDPAGDGSGADGKRPKRDDVGSNEHEEGELCCIFFAGAPNDHPKCTKKYKYMSELQKHLESGAHHFYACYRCLTRFKNANQYFRHKRNDRCIKSCSITGCLRHHASTDILSTFDCDCITSSRQQWLALYLLLYPSHLNPVGYESVPRKAQAPVLDSNHNVPPVTSSFDFDALDFFNDSQQYASSSLAGTSQNAQEDFNVMQSIEGPFLDRSNLAPDHEVEVTLAQTRSKVELLERQVEILEKEVSRKTTSHEQIAAVLGMVWQALVETGCSASRERSTLWGLVKSHAPDAIAATSEPPVPVSQPHAVPDSLAEPSVNAQQARPLGNLEFPHSAGLGGPQSRLMDWTFMNDPSLSTFPTAPPLALQGNASQPLQSRA